MKKEILAFLKQRLPGVSNTYLDGIASQWSKTITEESQIETALTDGVINSIKYSASFIQTEGDRRANEASTTAVKTYEEKHNLENGIPKTPGDPDPGKKPDPNNIGAIVAAEIAKAVAPLKSELEGYKQAETGKVYKQKLIDKLKEEGVGEDEITVYNLLSGVSITKEEEIDSIASGIVERHQTNKQALIDVGKLADTPKDGNHNPGEMKEKDYQEIMDEDPEEKKIGTVDLGL